MECTGRRAVGISSSPTRRIDVGLYSAWRAVERQWIAGGAEERRHETQRSGHGQQSRDVGSRDWHQRRGATRTGLRAGAATVAAVITVLGCCPPLRSLRRRCLVAAHVRIAGRGSQGRPLELSCRSLFRSERGEQQEKRDERRCNAAIWCREKTHQVRPHGMCGSTKIGALRYPGKVSHRSRLDGRNSVTCHGRPRHSFQTIERTLIRRSRDQPGSRACPAG
jgi:hypothetical protein